MDLKQTTIRPRPPNSCAQPPPNSCAQLDAHDHKEANFEVLLVPVSQLLILSWWPVLTGGGGGGQVDFWCTRSCSDFVHFRVAISAFAAKTTTPKEEQSPNHAERTKQTFPRPPHGPIRTGHQFSSSKSLAQPMAPKRPDIRDTRWPFEPSRPRTGSEKGLRCALDLVAV